MILIFLFFFLNPGQYVIFNRIDPELFLEINQGMSFKNARTLLFFNLKFAFICSDTFKVFNGYIFFILHKELSNTNLT